MPVDILQLHSHSTASPLNDILQLVHDGLSRDVGQKTLPTILLYDERGLRLYDDITTGAAEYYLFNAEEQILKDHADDIVKVMHGATNNAAAGEIVLELGAGALRKTSHVLSALARLVSERMSTTPMTYYALDLEQRELERTLGEIQNSSLGKQLEGKVNTKGMCGTYDDGLKYLSEGGLYTRATDELASMNEQTRNSGRDSPVSTHSSGSGSQGTLATDSTAPSSPDPSPAPFHIMFLGSSLGNFSRSSAPGFLRDLPLRPGYGDTLLIGLDHDNDRGLIETAYNDPCGHTEKFIKNGLRAAGRVLGDENLFDERNWEYINRYDPDERRHEAFIKAKVDHSTATASGSVYVFKKDEMLKIEESFKFSEVDAHSLFIEANLRPVQRWVDNNGYYSLWLVERPPFMFPLLSSPSAYNKRGELTLRQPFSVSTFGVPARQDWENMWALWDYVTLRMIPPSMLHEKPIDLRHVCLFYLGHIPTFLDIHLSRLLGEPHTEPEEYKYIFEVSEHKILGSQDLIRAQRGIDPDVDNPTQCHPHSEVPANLEDWPSLSDILYFQDRVRARLMSLYDSLDSGKLLLTRKMGRALFMTLEHEGLHVETLLYMLLQRAGTGTIPPPGFLEPDWKSLAADWEAAPGPLSKTVTLGPETITLGHDDAEAEDAHPDKVRDIKNYEYGWDNEHPKREVEVQRFEISWRPVTNGEFYEFFLGQGMDKIELPASWVVEDGVVQVRTLYGPVPMDVARHWPFMASYDHLSTYAMVKGGRLPTEPELRLFYDKFHFGYEGGANVGFRNWHPLPATTGGVRNGGKGDNGGVWEWTSTVFDKTEGFVPSELYPGYSMDFFDDKHQVVLGGSYATIPRLSERRSMRNWYQRNYPYPWVGGRIVYDLNARA
ncbi:DUF323 domain-containing protein [Macrolepiota fuliginosa MF-IS2]|uniref:DUF323 domain-containing protein n=1 Tax=Macrolepiota fuliginosa MF-IS2 TaxID=1400762 RepID=A0A9P6C973_9AGAR|nr:DUF323 domain-containing protein [Macrolepiota fuliginosa MF-IS2]